MQTGPQSEPIIVEPAEDPFKKDKPAPVQTPEPVRVPEKTPA